MKILTDDLKIFNILSEMKLEMFDPKKISVFDFSVDDSWCLFLFNPQGIHKGCRLYILENIEREIELREKLLPELISLPSDNGNFILKDKALKVVESIISNNKDGQLFFDAH